MTAVGALERSNSASRRYARLARAGRSQSLTILGQLSAGLANLLISIVLARVLLPADYAAFVSFLAAYLLIHTIASSATGAVALDPGMQQRLFRRSLILGLAVGGALAASAALIAPAVGLPQMMIVLLGITAPSAVLLAFARGRLYGRQNVGGTVGALCTEPLARGVLAAALVPLLGPIGGAVAVVGAGYAALCVATILGRPGGGESTHAAYRRADKSVVVTVTFLLIAVVATQDVIIANRILPADQASLVGAVATLGGAAYFATATIPMVLLPSSREGTGSLAVALIAAVLVSGCAVAVVAMIPSGWYSAVLGQQYHAAGRIALPYVSAMAAFGVAKVLLAELCATGRSVLAGSFVMIAALTQLSLLLSASSAGAIVRATAVASMLLLIAAALAVGIFRAACRPIPTMKDSATLVVPLDQMPVEARETLRSRMVTLWPLFLAMAVGVVLRTLVTRSIWVDEAISVQQAQLSFNDMITTLRRDDVHPPFFATLLWLLVHVTGSTAEWIVRLPSLIAGTAFVPVLYAMARDLWDRRTARAAGFVAAVAPIAVWYAQEARMYAIWMLCASVTAWAQCRILRDWWSEGKSSGRKRDWGVFLLGCGVLLYLQWFAVLPLLVQHAVFAITALRSRSWRLARAWLWSVGASLTLLLPLIPYLADQLSTVLAASSARDTPGQTGAAASAVSAQAPDIYAALANIIWAVWGYHADSAMVQLGALWPFALLLCFAALGRLPTRHGLVLAAIAVLPAFALFVLGFERRNFFELRYFTSTVPIVLIFISRLAAVWGRGPLTRLILPIVLVASLGWGLADQQVNQSNPRIYDFRGAVAWVQSKGDSEDLLLYAPQFLNHELAYYPAGMRTVPAAGYSPRLLRQGHNGPAEGRSIFVFASFLDRPDVAAQVGRTLADLENSGNDKVGRYHVANVTVWEFRENTL